MFFCTQHHIHSVPELQFHVFPVGGVSPIPHPGKADQLLPLSGHLGDSLQPPGLP